MVDERAQQVDARFPRGGRCEGTAPPTAAVLPHFKGIVLEEVEAGVAGVLPVRVRCRHGQAGRVRLVLLAGDGGAGEPAVDEVPAELGRQYVGGFVKGERGDAETDGEAGECEDGYVAVGGEGGAVGRHLTLHERLVGRELLVEEGRHHGRLVEDELVLGKVARREEAVAYGGVDEADPDSGRILGSAAEELERSLGRVELANMGQRHSRRVWEGIRRSRMAQ